ncbi:MAG TPA: Rieske 2Fe-2S domain-containing protein [Aliidongia sp.]|uniref:Rieske 2Fe-2S domain-containing protein n=1 Tax=Aliidongia sp. TaxID=1914230 RepID=UPI002DDD22E7|nr:Rieske 2Fe-2S domain-containing protein [Aliidongia sp.]HEV2673538.1 Rieske 2Fe-2S domain-containing protein [Aliidongia sp.]
MTTATTSSQSSPWRTRWFFVCPVDRLAEDDCHVTVDLPERSITLQNDRGTLTGFENACAHRSLPLRPAGFGRGLLRCQHGWTYNADGIPVGIPDDDEQADLDLAGRERLALRQIGVAVMEGGIFARVEDDGSLPDAAWLADAELAGAAQRLAIDRLLRAGAAPPAEGSTLGNLSVDLMGDFALLGWVVPQGADAIRATVALYALAEAPDEIPIETQARYDKAAQGLARAAG